jgi:hypothetical protein
MTKKEYLKGPVQTRIFGIILKPRVSLLIAFALYALIGLAVYWPIYPGDSSKLPSCVCGDTVQSIWLLRWLPYALTHSRNPLFTSWINAPLGANLAQNTLMPLLGLITLPLTLIVSPVASFNLLAWLAFPLSAFAMMYVVRRLTGSTLAGFVAGLLYGFSPYMIGQGSGHIMLTFVPLPPLILLTTWELLIHQKKSPWKTGITLAVEVIAQFLIEPEVLAIVAIMLIIGSIGLIIARRRYVTKKRIKFVTKGFGLTVLISIIVLAYPIWFMTSGPQHFKGSNFPADNPYRSDLYGLVVPTSNERLLPGAFHHFAHITAGGDYPETGDYIGIVLLLIIIASVIRWRRNRWLVFSSVLALICWILSLGPSLVVYGKTTSIKLPFALLVRLPLIQDILPGRFALDEWILVSIIVALIITELRKDTKTKKNINVKLIWAKRVLLSLVSIAVLSTLMPRIPYPSAKVNIPSEFSPSSKLIPLNSKVLFYPYPLFPNDQAMLWQANNGMRFKLLGGYIQNDDSQGKENEYPPLLYPPELQEWFIFEQHSVALWPASSSINSNDIRSFLYQENIGTVVIQTTVPNSSVVISRFKHALGPPMYYQGVVIWTNIKS